MKKFSKWTKWKSRHSFEDRKYPGVYLLGRFLGGAPHKVNKLDKNIIYIGETTSTLGKRWAQFHRSAFLGRKGHSGGCTYRKRYKNEGDNLYVTASFDNGKGERKGSLYIKYLERKLIWEYAKKYGKAPECNKN